MSSQIRAFDFRLPVTGYGTDVDSAFQDALGSLERVGIDSVRGDIEYREVPEDEAAEEVARALEIVGLSAHPNIVA